MSFIAFTASIRTTTRERRSSGQERVLEIGDKKHSTVQRSDDDDVVVHIADSLDFYFTFPLSQFHHSLWPGTLEFIKEPALTAAQLWSVLSAQIIEWLAGGVMISKKSSNSISKSTLGTVNTHQ